MHDLIAFIESNSALVIANPAAFATFAVLFGAGGFALGRYLLTERVANLESRIARRDEEITDLKAKRKAAEPEPPMLPIFGTSAIAPSPKPTRRPTLFVSDDNTGNFVAEQRDTEHVR